MKDIKKIMSINAAMRQIVLDTETTGINKFGLHYQGHRIIEIGAVEIINRRLTKKKFHVYLNPNCQIDSEAFRIHGISNRFLKDKPVFADIVNDFIHFISYSELIIHNAPFDLGFLNYELSMVVGTHVKKIESYCTVIDSLKLARKLFPGQRNSLDALCERYYLNHNEKRVLHNALIDAKLLANVFLMMTGGQTKMCFSESHDENILSHKTDNLSMLNRKSNFRTRGIPLKIIYADSAEKLEHDKYLEFLRNRKK